jgi:hypothetical protein
MRLIKKIESVLLLFMFAMPLQAALIEQDWSAINDAAITYDSTTGLEWLDVTVTAGLSYNDVAAELGVGGAYEGFSFASSQQVAGLFSAVGLGEIPNVPEFLGGGEQIQTLLGYWGVTWYLGTGERTEFLTSNTTGLLAGEHFTGRVFWLEVGDTGVTAEYLARDDDYSNFTIGSALVRAASPVPVPAAVWLFGSGLMGLIGFSRKYSV